MSWYRPSHHVPPTRWQASSRWRAKPVTIVILIAGLWLFGTGEAMLVQAGLGLAPWTVLAQGLTRHLPISIGLATFTVSVIVLLLWIPLRERPGLGTIANAVVIATSLQVMSGIVPKGANIAVDLLMTLAGIVVIGIGSGFYLTTHLGPGPRDGWMTGIHLRTGWPVWGVRIGIEATVLVVGWLLGGTVGVGTLLFAVLVGPAVGYGLVLAGFVGRPPHGASAPESSPTDAQYPEDEYPELDA